MKRKVGVVVLAVIAFLLVASIPARAVLWIYSCKDCSSGGGVCIGGSGCNGDVLDCWNCEFRCGGVQGGEIVYGGWILDCYLN